MHFRPCSRRTPKLISGGDRVVQDGGNPIVGAGPERDGSLENTHPPDASRRIGTDEG